jgi:purine-binding chemotaxis protein CheW
MVEPHPVDALICHASICRARKKLELLSCQESEQDVTEPTLGELLPAGRDRRNELHLICHVQARLCALALQHVVEIMRPLPVEPLAGAPCFVRGLAVVRGTPLPVVDAARLLDGDVPAQRFVKLHVGGRHVVLAVDEVLGVRAMPDDGLSALPPLLQEAGMDFVAAIGRLDAELLWVLEGARLLADVPEAKT